MLLRLFHFLVLDLPGQGAEQVMPVGATKVKYIEALEDNTGILYPALALLAIVLIALGILQALRSDDMDAVNKAELKREIIRELRLEIHGMTAETLAKKVNQPSHRLARLLEEMVEAGMVESITDTRRITTWRVKGLRA